MAFEGLTQRLAGTFKKLKNRGKLSESDVKEAMREVRLALAEPELNHRIEQFEYNGGKITNYEMESAALQGLAKLMGHHAMTICSIIANRVATSANPNYKTAMNDLVGNVLDRLLG